MRRFCFLLIFFCLVKPVSAQDYFLTGHYSSISEKDAYYNNSNTLIKPVFGCENPLFDSLIFNVSNDKSKSLLVRKLFNEHLIVRENEKFKLIVDPYVDFRMNYDSERQDFSYMNRRGFSLYGNLISRIYISTGFEENQAKFTQYIHDFYKKFGVIPGYGRIKEAGNNIFDFSNSYGSITFKANSMHSFTLGYDKLFIGDGYRSMLLSDFSAPYMFFKASMNFGNFEYNKIITKAANPNYNHIMGAYTEFNINSKYPSKIISYNCLTYNIKSNWKITLFDVLLLPGDTKFLPVLGYVTAPYIFDFIEVQDLKTPNALIGMNLLYQNKKTGIFYGQLVCDYFANARVAAQLGYKSFNFFNLKNLYFQAEYNTAGIGMYMYPFTELHYGHQNQSLAHPAGSGFDEILGIAGYSLYRFELIFKINYLRYKYGFDSSFDPQNIFNWNDYYTATHSKNREKREVINADIQLIYNLNRAYRIQIFAGMAYRSDNFINSGSYFFNFGLRTALRYNYYDF